MKHDPLGEITTILLRRARLQKMFETFRLSCMEIQKAGAGRYEGLNQISFPATTMPDQFDVVVPGTRARFSFEFAPGVSSDEAMMVAYRVPADPDSPLVEAARLKFGMDTNTDMPMEPGSRQTALIAGSEGPFEIFTQMILAAMKV